MMPSDETIEAFDETIKATVTLVALLGIRDDALIHAIAVALGREYLRGVNDGGRIAIDAIDEVLGRSASSVVH